MSIDTTEHNQPDHVLLGQFETDWLDESGHVMVCAECGDIVCHIEMGDTLAEWTGAAYSHECPDDNDSDDDDECDCADSGCAEPGRTPRAD